MDSTKNIKMEYSDNVVFKIFSGTMSGFVGGGIWGAVVSSSYNIVPKVERVEGYKPQYSLHTPGLDVVHGNIVHSNISGHRKILIFSLFMQINTRSSDV